MCLRNGTASGNCGSVRQLFPALSALMKLVFTILCSQSWRKPVSCPFFFSTPRQDCHLLVTLKKSASVPYIQSFASFSSRFGEWLTIPVFLPGKSHGQRSLVGYTPWGCKKSDMTERLSLKSRLLQGADQKELCPQSFQYVSFQEVGPNSLLPLCVGSA